MMAKDAKQTNLSVAQIVISFVSYARRISFGHLSSQCSAEKFHNWGQCPRALGKVGTLEKKVGTLWGK